MTVFLLFLVLFGIFSFLAFVAAPVMSWQRARNWVETTCRITAVTEGETDDPEVRYRYVFGERSHEGNRIRFGIGAPVQPNARPFAIDSEVACWFDPERPEHAVLDRTLSGWIALPLAFSLAIVWVGMRGLRGGEIAEGDNTGPTW